MDAVGRRWRRGIPPAVTRPQGRDLGGYTHTQTDTHRMMLVYQETLKKTFKKKVLLLYESTLTKKTKCKVKTTSNQL